MSIDMKQLTISDIAIGVCLGVALAGLAEAIADALLKIKMKI